MLSGTMVYIICIKISVNKNNNLYKSAKCSLAKIAATSILDLFSDRVTITVFISSIDKEFIDH